jgi:TonB family protein
MIPRNILILSIVISLVSHLVILSLTGFIDMRGRREKADFLTVELNQPLDESRQTPKDERKTAPSPPPMEGAPMPEDREETVALDSKDNRYTPYLKKLRISIETVWAYPPKALEQNQEGTTVIRFSIDRNGALAAVQVLTSSGFDAIDEGAVSAVRDAAPYEPLPQKLSRLHILATFEYRLTE